MKWPAPVAVIFAIAVCLVLPASAQNYGTVSDGSCSCKTRCDGGNSRFSAGRTVAQCRAQCVRSFSGCSRGEIRLPGVRPGQRVQSAARSTVGPSAPARSAGVRRRISCDRFGCHRSAASFTGALDDRSHLLSNRLWPVCITASELSRLPNRPPPALLPYREAVSCGHSMAMICCSGRRYFL
jgi:hypothetical protein